MPLRVQLLLLQAVIVCLVTAVTGVLAGTLQERAIRDAYQDRMRAVAQSVARLPVITDAFAEERPAETIQPVAELIREASDLTYVVVADADGIRYSHPNPDRIGEPVSTDPSIPLSGEVYVGTQTGTLGTSWRVKVPIFDADGAVMGTASVGILESQLTADFMETLSWLVGAMILSALLGVFGAAWVTSVIRKRIHRLEPAEITSLVANRETTLHGLSEGVITVDEHGTVTLVNDAAVRLLGGSAADLVGRPAGSVLDAELLTVLREGEPDGRAVLSGERVLIARSTGSRIADVPVAATLLLRDHTELHQMLQRAAAADAILDFRARFGLPKGLSAETLERVATALHDLPGASATEIAEATGLSRVSCRRYLEHLASVGRAHRTLDYSRSGRPGARYRIIQRDAANAQSVG